MGETCQKQTNSVNPALTLPIGKVVLLFVFDPFWTGLIHFGQI